MYEIGEKVVHPMHGAGIIQGLKTIELKGVARDYYVVSFAVGSMVSDIPVENCDKIGIRRVISKEDAKKVLEHFHNYEIGDDKNWNKRQRENIIKLKSGDILQVADILKELMCREKRKGLSTSERKTLYSARQIVLSELILSGVAGESDIEMILEDTVAQVVGQ